MEPGDYHKEAILKWNKELEDMIIKYPPTIISVPDELQFPFMMVYHRNKISVRNNNYLVAVACFAIHDVIISKRNLAHKGWPNMTQMFTLPEFMKEDKDRPRYVFYGFQNWDGVESNIPEEEKCLLTELRIKFPCPETQIKQKNNQYKIIL